MDCTQEHIEEQRILSFCYGYGGLERGLNAVMPIRPVAYVEIEAFQNFNLVTAMEKGLVDQAPLWTNLKTFDARPFHNRIHGIVGGYPCQGESLAGKRQLWNDDRFLWPYIERAIEATQPLWVAFENVSGHISGSFPYVLDSLRRMGYAVEAGLFTASEVGAPHKRERLFIFGIRKDTFDRGFWQSLANTSNSYGSNKQIMEQNQTTTSKGGESQLDNPNNLGDRTGLGEVSKEDGEIQKRNENAESIKSGESELGNTTSPDKQMLQFESGYEKKPIGGSGEVGHSTSQRLQEPGLNEQSSNDLANSCNQGLSIGKKQPTWKECEAIKRSCFQGGKWPSRPGEQQHEWEEKRTVESGVGCTINGYNFRTELLRQYGNGVVSQQAANAFETLIMKLLNDNKIL